MRTFEQDLNIINHNVNYQQISNYLNMLSSKLEKYYSLYQNSSVGSEWNFYFDEISKLSVFLSFANKNFSMICDNGSIQRITLNQFIRDNYTAVCFYHVDLMQSQDILNLLRTDEVVQIPVIQATSADFGGLFHTATLDSENIAPPVNHSTGYSNG